MRRCNHCGQEKVLSFDNFARGGESNGGFCPYCRECSPGVQRPYREERKREEVRTKVKTHFKSGQLSFFHAEAYF